MRTGTGRFGIGGARDGSGDLRRADVYSDEALWRARYDRLLSERDMWRTVAALARFAVPVPPGEVASAYAAEDRPPQLVVVPLQRVAPTGVPAKPRIHNPRKGQR